MQNAHALPISSIPNPFPPPVATSFVKAPGHRFGRTALLIHLLAWLALSVAWTLMIIMGEESPESQATQGVGGAAAFAFGAWSGLLALRAIWHGERVLLPTFILILCGAEATGPCLWLWDPLLTGNNPLTPLFEFTLWAGLPLFVPFFFFGSILALPVAWLTAWMMERWRRKQSADTWTRRRRLKTGLVAYLVVFFLLIGTIFPYALYAYVALEQNHRKIWSSPFNWQAPVLARIPDSIRTGLDEFCSKRLPWRFVLHRVALIETGQLPKERLLVNMHDPWEEVQAASWRTFFRNYPEEAMSLARQLMSDEDAEHRLQATRDFWHGRTVLGLWPAKTKRAWMTFLIGQLNDTDLRVRRGVALLLLECLGKRKPTRAVASIPWPWDERPMAELPRETDSIEQVRQAAELLLTAQRK